MKTQELYELLLNSDSLLPQQVLEKGDYKQLASELTIIFNTYTDELRDDERFRKNFAELVNYVYLDVLSKTPDKRDKEPFTSNLTTFLLKYRAA